MKAISRFLHCPSVYRQRETGRAWSARNQEHLRAYRANYHANRRYHPDTRAHVLQQDAESRARKRELKGLTLGETDGYTRHRFRNS